MLLLSGLAIVLELLLVSSHLVLVHKCGQLFLSAFYLFLCLSGFCDASWKKIRWNHRQPLCSEPRQNAENRDSTTELDLSVLDPKL